MGKVAVGLLLVYPPIIIIACISCNRHRHHHCLSCKSRFWRSVRPIIWFGSLLMGRYEQLVNLISMSLDNWSWLICLKIQLISWTARQLIFMDGKDVGWERLTNYLVSLNCQPATLSGSPVLSRSRRANTNLFVLEEDFSNLEELLKLGRGLSPVPKY